MIVILTSGPLVGNTLEYLAYLNHTSSPISQGNQTPKTTPSPPPNLPKNHQNITQLLRIPKHSNHHTHTQPSPNPSTPTKKNGISLPSSPLPPPPNRPPSPKKLTTQIKNRHQPTTKKPSPSSTNAAPVAWRSHHWATCCARAGRTRHWRRLASWRSRLGGIVSFCFFWVSPLFFRARNITGVRWLGGR